MKIKFSVVTVVFNGEKSIRKTIESVLNQTLPPYEYLIFDGASTDHTLAIAQEYTPAFSQRGIDFRVVSEKDNGIYNAMNKGIDTSRGDFISFLNAGDWYELDALEQVADFHAREPFELTYGGLHYIRPDGSVINKMSRLDSFPVSSRNWNHPSMFLKTDIYRKYRFDERFRAYADFHLYLKLRKDGTKIRVIDRVLTNFVADGVSTNVALKKVLARAGEKYRAYIENGYGRIYWMEAYGWEMMKSLYFRLHSKR